MNELYIKRVKSRLKTAMELGSLNAEQQIMIIDDTLEKLLLMDDKNINESITKFYQENKNLEEELKETQQKLINNYKKVYDKLMEDL